MFDNITTIKAYDPLERYALGEESDKPIKNLDSQKAQDKVRKLVTWWVEEREFQAENRNEQATDQDFYDHLQWREEDKSALVARGQLPLVFNKSKIIIDWMIGTERKGRFDFNLFPRREDAVEVAQIKTDFLKYLSDVNKTAFYRSMAFKQALIVGVGWLEDGVREDPTDEAIFSRCENWRNIWFDHLSVEPDLSDARYLFRVKWLDEDVAISMFPEREAEIKAAVYANSFTGFYDEIEDWWNARYTTQVDGTTLRTNAFNTYSISEHSRNRVRLIEAWYREPSKMQIMRGAQGQGELGAYEGRVFNEKNNYMKYLVDKEYASIYDAVKMRVRCAIFIGDAIDITSLNANTIMGKSMLLQDMPSPYAHNRFPFTPVWAYRRGRDGLPYGVMRGLRDAQEDMNKRHSKSLYILSSNKVIVDNNAVEDWDEFRSEIDRPDGVIKVRQGARCDIAVDRDLATGHLQMLDRDSGFMEQISGVTDENLGRRTNAVSGKAIMARQEQGHVAVAEIFDNLRLAMQLQGETLISLIEQFCTEQRVFRLVGTPKNEIKFKTINQQLEDGRVLNDITADKADFIIDKQEYRESVRVALFESMMNLLGQQPPEVTMQVLDMVMELSDLPNKDEWIKRIRKLNGNISPEDMTPEEQQAQQEQQQQQQQMMQAQMDLQNAQIEKLRAEAAKVKQEVEKIRAETDLTTEEITSEKVQQHLRMSQQAGINEKIKVGKAQAVASIITATNAAKKKDNKEK